MKNKEQLLNKDNWVQYLKLAIEGGLTINAIANDIVSKIDKALTPTTEEVNKFLDDNYPTKTHYITTEEIDERIYLNNYPEEI